jgi:hypothetical protein
MGQATFYLNHRRFGNPRDLAGKHSVFNLRGTGNMAVTASTLLSAGLVRVLVGALGLGSVDKSEPRSG